MAEDIIELMMQAGRSVTRRSGSFEVKATIDDTRGKVGGWRLSRACQERMGGGAFMACFAFFDSTL